MLLRLPYLALSSVFAFIRLLPMSTVDKGNLGPLCAFYQRIWSRRGIQVAFAATARKATTSRWHLVTKGQGHAFAHPGRQASRRHAARTVDIVRDLLDSRSDAEMATRQARHRRWCIAWDSDIEAYRPLLPPQAASEHRPRDRTGSAKPTSHRRTIAGCPVDNRYVAFVHIFSVQQPSPP